MKDARTLLRLLTDAFPLKKGKHALILEGDALMISVQYEDHWHNMGFEEEDLTASPESVAAAIIAMVPESERRYRDSLTHETKSLETKTP